MEKNRIMILDGAMGTMLQAAGLKLGQKPEVFGMEHPEIVERIQGSYIEAGSDVIYANTFGANAHKLAGTGVSAAEAVKANIRTAKAAAKHFAGDRKVRVALDIGPIGELMEPIGTLSFDNAYAIFREMIEAGEEAGADLIVFETMTDLYEVKAGVLAARENSKLPVWVTMSFEQSGRTFTGTKVACMAATLDALEVDAMGINCSLGPKEILPLIREMREWTDRPLIVKPNAGLPDPATGGYEMTAADFGEQMSEFFKLNIPIMGGCCGTTPDFIAELAKCRESNGLLPDAESAEIPSVAESAGLNTETDAGNISSIVPKRRGICSASQMTEFSGVRIIGERINPTGKKRFQQALREHDMNYIMERAIEQADAGADILDINVGLPGIDEPQMMEDVVKAVQSVVTLPLQIDSSNPEAIEAGLRYANGRAMVNSVNAEPEKLEAILPVVRKYGAVVVGLTMDRSGIPETAEARFSMASHILDEAVKTGIPRDDVVIDCLTLTVSAQQEQAMETLKAVRMVHEQLGLHCVLGVSNISFGLPQRTHVTTSFLTMAMLNGLDLPIVNPNQEEIMDTIFSFRALSGEDRGCEAYIGRFTQAAEEKAPAAPAAGTAEMTIAAAVLKGLKQETLELTKKKLESMTEIEVIDLELIPALDEVGKKYEAGKIFLPQLINAANAASAGFDEIKLRIAEKGGESVSKGKILLATVEGDIHDIGKNIVKVVLENYGYQVIDLGRDVPVQTVADAAIREDVKLVGLSALMTTTVASMKATIEAIRKSGHDCKIMVGGAVLTPEYAAEIGADYYTKDAKASVDVARTVFG